MMKQNKEIPKGYKDSPLGIIPEEWEVKRLGEIAKIHVAKDLKISNFSKTQTLEHIYPIYSNTVENEGFYGGYYDFEEYKGNCLTVVGRGIGLGTAFSRKKGFGAIGRLLIIYPKLTNDCKFITEYINGRINILVESAAIPQLTGEQFSTYKIALPPIPEQQKIAEILSTWDKAIEKQTALVEKLELRKRGLMQQLLTGKKQLTNSTSWQMTKAGSLFKNVSNKGFENEKLLSATQENGVIPRDMLEGRVTMPSGETKSFKLVEIGDFVISLRSFQGGIEYSYYRGVVSPAYTVLKPKKEICNEYYKQYFKSCDFISRLAVAVIGIRDGKQISYDDFCFIKIPSPSLVQQIEIANILIAADKEIDLARIKLSTLRTQKNGLMQQFLTGKKRININ